MGDAQTHALILTGGTAERRLAEARRLVAEALCPSAEGRPCGVCLVCRRVSADGHPDVTFLSPASKDGKEGREIKVEQARRLRAGMALLPHEGRCRAAVIQADALNVHAQNALLALLEEPPRHARFFLLSQNPALLLPTLRSRCAVLRLPEPSGATAAGPAARSLWEALLSRDAWRWAEACLSLEKTRREEFSALLDGLSALLCASLPARDVLTARHFGGIIDKIRICQNMLEANVGAGHVCGLLACERLTAGD
jgi:hypothetical protein